ncbi:MAG: DUF6526 family protein [Bacteroidota bacterium]
MEEQNYSNHRHGFFQRDMIILLILILTAVGSVINLYLSLCDHQRLYTASLVAVLTICVLVQFWYGWENSIKIQDRAIRAEENLRHFALSGKLLDPNLKIGQIVALRFASNEEFVVLAKRAVDEKLSRDDIKKAVKTWRADHHRI